MRGSSHDSLSPPESIVLGLADSAITLRNTFEKYLEMYYEYYSSGSTNPFAYPSTLGVLQLYDSKSRQETKFPNQCNDWQPACGADIICRRRELGNNLLVSQMQVHDMRTPVPDVRASLA